MGDLFSLVESMDFDLQMGDRGESLMTEAELVANLPDDFLNPPLLPPPTTSPPRAPPPTPPLPVLQLSSTIPTNHIQLRQVGEPGPDGQVVFEVVTDNLQPPPDDLPDDLGYSSLPSSSSSVSPLSPTQEVGEVPGESKEERRLRLQAEACRRHRRNKKRKLEEGKEELVQLEKRNVELRAKHQAKLEEVMRWRSMVMLVVAGKKRLVGDRANGIWHPELVIGEALDSFSSLLLRPDGQVEQTIRTTTGLTCDLPLLSPLYPQVCSLTFDSLCNDEEYVVLSWGNYSTEFLPTPPNLSLLAHRLSSTSPSKITV